MRNEPESMQACICMPFPPQDLSLVVLEFAAIYCDVQIRHFNMTQLLWQIKDFLFRSYRNCSLDMQREMGACEQVTGCL